MSDSSVNKRPYARFSYESSSENIEAIPAQLAYDRAMAWALSAPGTPYGGTEAVRRLDAAGAALAALAGYQLDGATKGGQR